MTVSAKVYWDEENNPRPFYWSWAVSQFLLLADGLSLRSGGLHSALASWLNIVSIFAFIAPATIYCNLVINCIWHKTEWADQDDEDSVESLDISPVRLQDDPVQSIKSDRAPIFRTNLEGNPIEARDQIQWKKLLLATLGLSSLILTFVGIVGPSQH